jgi:HEAT repeats
MDRNVEFVTHLSCLVGLYAHGTDDPAAEQAALRSAHTAVNHGTIKLSVANAALSAGAHPLGEDVPGVPMLRDVLVRLGIHGIRVTRRAKQEEIEALARLLAGAVAGETDPEGFATGWAARRWTHVHIDRAVELPAATAGTPNSAEPVVAEHVVVEPAAAESAAAESAAVELEMPSDASGPLATHVPAAVEQLAEAAHRELFERLITSSETGTLRRLLEPIHQSIEQALREGRVSVALQLLLAMFACEGLCADPEMRRQFVVVTRRLTKPTVLRALAALYADEPQFGAAVEQVLLRFGEDGAEAVADRAMCAVSAEKRALYVALLGRLPGARDALGLMLADQRPPVVERAIALMVLLRLPDTEKLLADQLAHASARVRQAAAQGLAAFPKSAFAADALLRAVPDSSPEVRLTAAVAVQARRDSRLAPVLVQQLEDEEEFDVQLALVAALGRLAAHDGVQKLIALAMPDQRLRRRREGSALRLNAIEALAEARTPAAMVALQKLLDDKDKDVREAAARLYTRARRQTTAGSLPVVSEP